MSGIGIITNPHSKLNKRNPHRPALLGYILGEAGRLEITESLAELPLVAKKFKENNIEILAINGGDGTIARTLSAFINVYKDQPLPKVALLRGGTMNVVAKNLRIKGSPEGILFRLVERYSSGRPLPTKALTTLRIEDTYGFLYADGVSCAVLEEFYKKKSGALGASWLVMRVFFSALLKGKLAKRLLTSRQVNLTADNLAERSFVSSGIMAATIARMPLGPKLFPNTLAGERGFQWFVVKTPPEKLTRDLLKIVWHTGTGERDSKFSQFSESLAIATEAPFTYTLDGEIFQATGRGLELSLGPQIEFVI